VHLGNDRADLHTGCTLNVSTKILNNGANLAAHIIGRTCNDHLRD
jgi:hypothetical protein